MSYFDASTSSLVGSRVVDSLRFRLSFLLIAPVENIVSGSMGLGLSAFGVTEKLGARGPFGRAGLLPRLSSAPKFWRRYGGNSPLLLGREVEINGEMLRRPSEEPSNAKGGRLGLPLLGGRSSSPSPSIWCEVLLLNGPFCSSSDFRLIREKKVAFEAVSGVLGVLTLLRDGGLISLSSVGVLGP